MLNLLRFHDVAAYPEGHEHDGKGGAGVMWVKRIVFTSSRLILSSG